MKRRARPWGRILFNTLMAISLLLAIATAGLWVRSYQGGESIYIAIAQKNGIGVTSWEGQMRLYHVRYSTGDLQQPNHWARPTSQRIRGTVTYLISSRQLPVSRVLDLFITHWFATVLQVPLPLLWIWTKCRRRMHPPGHCPACGYDTRANPAKCSECRLEIVGRGS